jgi:hypothetical protein
VADETLAAAARVIAGDVAAGTSGRRHRDDRDHGSTQTRPDPGGNARHVAISYRQ